MGGSRTPGRAGSATVGAVRPYQRLVKRNSPEPTDRLFPGNHRELLNAILKQENLKFDRDDNRRYSLRHTHICFRLMEGADVYQITKNCRTSDEKYYTAHIKTHLNAVAINVRRVRHTLNTPTPASTVR